MKYIVLTLPLLITGQPENTNLIYALNNCYSLASYSDATIISKAETPNISYILSGT